MSRDVRLGAVVAELVSADLVVETRGSEDPLLTGVSQDSRAVRSGDLFLAWSGTGFDANDVVGDAVRRGAVAAVVERPTEDLDVPQVVVRDGRRAGALAASRYFGHPWKELFLVGVTGTNGKTTSALLIRDLLSRLGPSAAVGTLGLVQVDGSVRPGSEALTTPGPVDLARWMRELADAGVRHVAMEVSSHALDQRRVDGLEFQVAVFTNLSQDHLDYHPNLSAYRDAKLRLSELAASGGALVVNGEDAAWDDAFNGDRRVVRVGFGAGFDLQAAEVVSDANGSRFLLRWKGESLPVALPLLGRFNIENALGAAAVALTAGLDLARVASGLSEAPQTAGRLERVVEDPFTVLIDYAHTPEALDRVLETLRPLVRGRLIVLFGAGGDRDPGKRPEMGAAAGRWADLSVVTSDNPRTENPDRIIDEILPGLARSEFLRITDRREAIRTALTLAAPEDVVLLAGKGHETYQVLGTERHPFDERAIVLGLLAEGAP